VFCKLLAGPNTGFISPGYFDPGRFDGKI